MQVLAIILIFIAMGGAAESRELKSVHKVVITLVGIAAIAGIACFWI